MIFDSVQEAIDAGYEACKVCKPPKKDGSQEPQANYMLPEVLRCVKVIDGDTIKVVLDGEAVSVRLIGVNTPEKGQGAGARRAIL